MKVEILTFDGVEELDVFTPMTTLALAGFEVALVAADGPRQIEASNGTKLVVGQPMGADILVVPGGGWLDRAEHGAFAEAERGLVTALIAERFATGSILAAVCTGSMLLAAAGLLEGRPAITNQGAVDELVAAGARVIADARVVDDGQIITAGGITAGLDLGLWLVQRFRGPAAAVAAATALEYDRTGYVWRHPPTATEAGSSGDSLTLPQTELAKIALELARREPELIYNHSVRSYLFARLTAATRGLTAGADYDDELLFLSCVLHDIGVTPQADRGRRFEVDGAEAAMALLSANGLDAARAQVVWEAIALHTSPGIADQRCTEVALTRAGVAMDFGTGAEFVPDQLATRIHARYPRGAMARCLAETIINQAQDRPHKAPPYTLPGELVRERGDPQAESRLEAGARHGRWGS